MRLLSKYAAILFLILIFPTIRFVANNFILESSTAIYGYIPQESDLVVEINSRNFVSEMAYQRIFNEAYFMKKIYPSTEEKQGSEPSLEMQETKNGIDIFSKVILFREQWANETIWIGLLKYTDESALRKFIHENIGDGENQIEFNDSYAVVQLSPSSNQERLNEHLKKIANKEVKGFSERVDLKFYFDPDKEINCYIIPKNTEQNKLIDGYLSFDFLQNSIRIEGSFTPLPEFNGSSPIAYQTDESKALTLRSSLNVFNSIYWFNEEKIEDIPHYSQLVFDYDGIDCKLINRNQGFSFPFKSYPKTNIHFDIIDPLVWNDFFTTLEGNKEFLVDTLNKKLLTATGASFNYDLTNQSFRLMQNSFGLVPATDSNLYFDLKMNVDGMINNTTFGVDEENPPSVLEQTLGIAIAEEIMGEIKMLATLETVDFEIRKSDNSNEIDAIGTITTKEKNGQAMVESLSLGMATLLFLSNY